MRKSFDDSVCAGNQRTLLFRYRPSELSDRDAVGSLRIHMGPLRICIVLNLLVAPALAWAHVDAIEPREIRTRFEIQRPSDPKIYLQPWNIDWHRTYAWQHGNAKPTPYFAPPGCYINRRVTTPDGANLQNMYICR